MKKILILFLLFVLTGCSAVSESGGGGGGGYVHPSTPVTRNYVDVYSGNPSAIVGAEFTDVTANTNIMLKSVLWGDSDISQNYLCFDVEAGQEFKVITLYVNGVTFNHGISSNNDAHTIYFLMGDENIYYPGNVVEVAVNKELDINDSTNYFKWYDENGLREFYYIDEFKR